jgi:hypothetical protein
MRRRADNPVDWYPTRQDPDIVRVRDCLEDDAAWPVRKIGTALRKLAPQLRSIGQRYYKEMTENTDV